MMSLPACLCGGTGGRREEDFSRTDGGQPRGSQSPGFPLTPDLLILQYRMRIREGEE